MKQIIRDLGDGLILRRSRPADAEALAAFNGRIHATPSQTPSVGVMAWTRDLLSRPHPTFGPGDFTIVEDARTGTIVSSLNLISQTWSYGGVEFGVGRPELVGTDPAYRQRGLVRIQMEEVHRWSAERGEKVQAITGIPYFYRQFGYEMSLMLHGARVGDPTTVPKLKDGEAEAYRVRVATEDDLPFIATVYAESARRYLVTCVRDQALWKYELRGRSDESGERRRLGVVEATDGEPVGFLVYRVILPERGSWYVTGFEVKAGVSWLAVAPSVLRHLAATLDEAGAKAENTQARRLIFDLGPEHPLFQVAAPYLPQTYNPYAWYIRVANLPDFLRHITPVLERRLAESIAVGHSGEVKVGFYRGGVRLRFERGRLTGVEDWPQTSEEISDARFPDLTFLQLLFGYRALEELEYAFPDCRAPNNEARVILKALFPKQPSYVWPVA